MNDILADFARWYVETLASESDTVAPVPPAIDLATLLGHFIALRQEINLQTRSVRAQQEQTADFAREVSQTLESMAKPSRPAAGEKEDAVRPLLESLIEIYDALDRAGAQIQKTRVSLTTPSEAPAPAPAPAAPFWRRWFGSSSTRPPAKLSQEPPARLNDRVTAALDGLAAGYTMSLERIDRTLRQHGLEPIESVGRSFDPESMEALEAVANSGRPSGEVVEEVRRGYQFNGRVFRCALVRVAKDSPR